MPWRMHLNCNQTNAHVVHYRHLWWQLFAVQEFDLCSVGGICACYFNAAWATRHSWGEGVTRGVMLCLRHPQKYLSHIYFGHKRHHNYQLQNYVLLMLFGLMPSLALSLSICIFIWSTPLRVPSFPLCLAGCTSFSTRLRPLVGQFRKNLSIWRRSLFKSATQRSQIFLTICLMMP